MTTFIPGLELGRLFYEEAIRPALDAEFPGLPHSAALIGYGSEVLGFDAPRSTDHEWGPRGLLFLREEDYAAHSERVVEALGRRLPPMFRGYSSHYGEPGPDGARLPERHRSGPVRHKVEVSTLRRFFESRLGLYPNEDLRPADWLTLPQQRLLELTAGAVWHDGLGELEPLRARLAYYPRDVWLCLLAAQWRRVEQQEPFVGRAGEAGDELGSALVAAALVRDLMGLCFLLERRYAPYSKWFGTAFARLACGHSLGPILASALAARGWRAREEALTAAYRLVARMHNGLGVTPPLDPEPSPYHGRPYLVIHAGRFAEALRAAIADPEALALPPHLGSVDQWVDSTDVLAYPKVYRRLRLVYIREPAG
jgi:hypothetical protein